MKKIVIAAAMAAVATLAQAQVTVYGKLNATIDSTTTGSAAAVNSMVNDGSRLGIKVTEDLGAGMSARAVIETAVGSQDPTTAGNTQLGDRQSTVGLAAKFGTVDFGRQTHQAYNTLGKYDVFGANYGTVAGDIHNLQGKRLSNGVFVTAAVIPGVAVGVDRTYTATGEEATAYSAGAKLGPVDAGVAYYEKGAEKSTVLGASTKLGATTVSYSYSDNKGSAAKKGNLIGVAQTFGAVTVKGSYGETNTDVKAYNLGADYNLSKRTIVGVAYRKVESTTDVKQVGVGLTHWF